MHGAFVAVAVAGSFAAAGWIGAALSQALYGGLAPEIGGPPATDIPAWAFAAAAASVGLFVGLHDGEPVQIAMLWIVVVALTVCAATDFRAGLIPDLFSLGALLVVLGYALVRHDWTPFLGALFVAVPFAAVAWFSRGRGMGWGDVKVAVLGGALLGLAGSTVAVALASLSAVIVGWARGRVREPIAFGAYLAAAIGLLLAAGSAV